MTPAEISTEPGEIDRGREERVGGRVGGRGRRMREREERESVREREKGRVREGEEEEGEGEGYVKGRRGRTGE